MEELGELEKIEDSVEQAPDTLVREYGEDAMGKAIVIAREKVDEFIKVLGEESASSCVVKAPITDENGTEHFWLTDVSYKDGVFTGAIGNDPGLVKHVKYGQSWSVKKDEISDWMYFRGEKIHGGFTLEVLLDTYPKEKADALREKLVR